MTGLDRTEDIVRLPIDGEAPTSSSERSLRLSVMPSMVVLSMTLSPHEIVVGEARNLLQQHAIPLE